MPDVVEIAYRFRADRSATNAAIRDNQRIENSLRDISAASQRTETAYTDQEQAAERVARAQREMFESQIKLAREQSELYGDTASRVSALSGLSSAVGGAGLSERLMLGADVLDAVEAMRLMRSELPALVGQLGLTTSNLAAMGVAAAAVAVTVLVFKDALDDANKAAEATKQAIVGQITALQEYYSFIGDATRDDILARTEEIRARRELQGQLLSDLLGLREAIEAGLDVSDQGAMETLAEGSIRALDALGKMGFGLDELNDAIDEVQTGLQADSVMFNLLTDAIMNNVTATNDALALEQEATRRKIEGLQREATLQAEVATLIRTGTSQAIEEQIAALQDQIAAHEAERDQLLALDDTSGQATERLSALDDELFVLREREDALVNQALPLIQVREDEAEAIDDLRQRTEAFVQALKGGAESVGNIAQAGQDLARKMQEGAQMIAEFETAQTEIERKAKLDAIAAGKAAASERTQIITESEAEIVSVTAEYEQERTNAIEETERAIAEREKKLGDQIAEYNRQRQEERTKTEARHRKEDIQALEDYLRERARAEEDHADNLLDAAARLDGFAVLAEQKRFEKQEKRATQDFDFAQKRRDEQQKDELDAQEKAFDDRIAQAQKSYDEWEKTERDHLQRRLDQLKEQERQELATVEKAKQDRLAELEAQHAAELERIRAQKQDRLDALEDQNQAELAALFGFQQDEVEVRQEHYNTLRTQLNDWFDDIEADVDGRGVVSNRTYQFGGYTPSQPSRVLTHPGEFVATRATTQLLERGVGGSLTQSNVQNLVQRSMGDFNMPLNVNMGQMSARALQRMVQQTVQTTLAQAFGAA